MTHKSLTAVVAAPFLLAAWGCAATKPDTPSSQTTVVEPPLQIEFVGARRSARMFGYINPIDGRPMQGVIPPSAMYIDKGTMQRYQFSCAALGKIIDRGIIDLNLSPSSEAKDTHKANLDQLWVGYNVLRCGRSMDA